MKCMEVDAEQRDAFLHGEQALEPVGHHAGGCHDEDGLPPGLREQGADALGEGVLERLERAVDDAQTSSLGAHEASLAILLTYPP